MALHTRRGVLLGAAGLLAGLAGCNEDPESTGTPAERAPTDPGEPRDLGDTGTRDPEQYALRGDDGGGTIAWFTEDAESSGDSAGSGDGTDETNGDGGATDSGTIPPHERRDGGLITDEATAATLSFADVEGAEEARAFVESTDFDSESVYLHQTPLGDCYRLELCSVSWGEEVSLWYVPVLENYDVACSSEERDTLATFVRIPSRSTRAERSRSNARTAPDGVAGRGTVRRRANGARTRRRPARTGRRPLPRPRGATDDRRIAVDPPRCPRARRRGAHGRL